MKTNKNKGQVSAVSSLIKSFANKKIKEADFLAQLFLQFRTRKEIHSLLYSLLSRDERKMIATRMLIIKMLKEDVSQHEISKRLKVGVLTVSRGAAEIQKGGFKFI